MVRQAAAGNVFQASGFINVNCDSGAIINSAAVTPAMTSISTSAQVSSPHSPLFGSSCDSDSLLLLASDTFVFLLRRHFAERSSLFLTCVFVKLKEEFAGLQRRISSGLESKTCGLGSCLNFVNQFVRPTYQNPHSVKIAFVILLI